jgi:hypothetical protein
VRPYHAITMTMHAIAMRPTIAGMIDRDTDLGRCESGLDIQYPRCKYVNKHAKKERKKERKKEGRKVIE